MSLTDQKKRFLLKVTILAIAMIQMPVMSITPAIARICAHFPAYEVAAVQTVLNVPNLVSPFVSLLAPLLAKRFGMKKVVLAGLLLLAAAGVMFLLIHESLYVFAAWGCLTGIAIGLFIPVTSSIMIARFDDNERRSLSGLQTSFISVGGVLIGLVGGVIAKSLWCGGYALFLLGLPIAVMSGFFIPRDETSVPAARAAGVSDQSGGFLRSVPTDIYYYSLIIFIFMMHNSVSGNNIALLFEQKALGSSSAAGVAVSVSMLGGVLSGVLFSRVSKLARDYTICIAFLIVCVGYTCTSLASSLPAALCCVFVSGMAMSLLMPQCLYALSLRVDGRTSVFATGLSMSVAPGLGGFLSPTVFTRTTNWLRPGDVAFRYRFVAVSALCFALLFFFITRYRGRKKNAAAQG